MTQHRQAPRSASPVVVTGGAGFLGSHLCERLVRQGHTVICVDDLSTGSLENLGSFHDDPRFHFVEAEVTRTSLRSELARFAPRYVVHLASPASPEDYLRMPLRTLRCGSLGTEHALDLAVAARARFLLASTSEVYGDPLIHPQVESYWGNVNPTGPRSVYDEAKRYAEALTMAYHRETGLSTGIARFFNTYGPRMRTDDGRLVPQLISEALRGDALSIHGDGTQTRSLCYVDDLIDGLLRLLHSDVHEPINIGNPEEYSVLEIAGIVADVTGMSTGLRFTSPRSDDPTRRRPDISRAREAIGWSPKISVRDGIAMTADWFRAARRYPALGTEALPAG
ncbi:NAD-dependent epimerase/dehydratase family protein [Actinokineospora sp.]|uniref:NAD-dependent epimerase/dehydratase family protein n=1 Tax=Actinokineospora sp. TaxID=1872133 RepID=UPI004037659A